MLGNKVVLTLAQMLAEVESRANVESVLNGVALDIKAGYIVDSSDNGNSIDVYKVEKVGGAYTNRREFNVS
ncbi:TPA: hypothetical protein ACJGQJ_002563 [Salmonella enterica subsp. enterica serovar Mgulani]